MKQVIMTGASGLIGTALQASLKAQGTDVIRLVRSREEAGQNAIFWNPAGDGPVADLDALEGCDAAVHLAGANVAAHRWTEEYKRTIVESRVNSSRALLRALGGLRDRPRVLISASAIGIYGDRGDEVLTEASAPGKGFLAEVCQQWEAATDGARNLGMRVVHLRFGVVLARGGGALETMLPLFRAGLGGKAGSGRQWMSWLTLADAVRSIEFALGQDSLAGACNVVAPRPVRNAEWTAALARNLHRPAVLTAPAFALRLAFGQMAQEAVLASTRAAPQRLEEAGFHFAHDQLDGALAAVL